MMMMMTTTMMMMKKPTLIRQQLFSLVTLLAIQLPQLGLCCHQHHHHHCHYCCCYRYHNRSQNHPFDNNAEVSQQKTRLAIRV